MNLWYYFNILEPTHINIILFFLILVVCACIGAVFIGAVFDTKTMDTKTFDRFMILGAFLGGMWFLFLMWLFMGKGFWWSLIIRNWLNS